MEGIDFGWLMGRETLPPQYRGQLGAQDLDGHQPIVLEVLGEVACRHTAAAYLPQDSVARSQSRSEVARIDPRGCPYCGIH